MCTVPTGELVQICLCRPVPPPAPSSQSQPRLCRSPGRKRDEAEGKRSLRRNYALAALASVCQDVPNSAEKQEWGQRLVPRPALPRAWPPSQDWPVKTQLLCQMGTMTVARQEGRMERGICK